MRTMPRRSIEEAVSCLRHRRTVALPGLVGLLLLVGLAACQNDARTGLVVGTGVGALMGQAIGGNTTGTLIGAAAGAGIGYIIGNERDKARADELTRANAAAAANAQATANAAAATANAAAATAEAASAAASARPAAASSATIDRPTHTEVGPLGDTRWLVVSINPRDAAPPHASMLVEFRRNGRVLTTTTLKDGTVESADESYRVVGDTLIINRPGYLVNARFQVSGNQLVISAERFSAVLTQLPS